MSDRRATPSASGSAASARALSRRGFVGTLLGGAAVTGALGCAANGAAGTSGASTDVATAPAGGGATTGTGTARPIGVQLYTVRSLMARDVPGTLQAIRDVGYAEVEFAGYHGTEPARLRATLDRLGLAAPSVHVGLEELRTRLDQVLADAATLGHRHVVLPWLEPPDRTPERYRRLIGDLRRVGAACRDRGLQFAYHNHEFEFATDVFPGTTPYDLLLAETDPALVRMELDLFWITHAGRDPLAYFARWPGRFPLVHVKDMRDPRGAKRMVEVGTGEIDFARILGASAQGGIRHLFVEHDNPADALASVRTSYANLRRILS